jgi:chromosome segregation ATPase
MSPAPSTESNTSLGTNHEQAITDESFRLADLSAIPWLDLAEYDIDPSTVGEIHNEADRIETEAVEATELFMRNLVIMMRLRSELDAILQPLAGNHRRLRWIEYKVAELNYQMDADKADLPRIRSRQAEADNVIALTNLTSAKAQIKKAELETAKAAELADAQERHEEAAADESATPMTDDERNQQIQEQYDAYGLDASTGSAANDVMQIASVQTEISACAEEVKRQEARKDELRRLFGDTQGRMTRNRHRRDRLLREYEELGTSSTELRRELANKKAAMRALGRAGSRVDQQPTWAAKTRWETRP